MALHYAIRNKLLADIRSIVESGADVNARDRDHRTPLIMCCLETDEIWAAGVARMLLQVGAKVGIRDKGERNALMYSSMLKRTELNNLFLKAVDFNLNQTDCLGNTALHFSALAGNETVTSNVLNALLRTGNDINIRNQLGQTPAGLALQLDHRSCMELFKYSCGNEFADFKTKIPPTLLLRPWNNELEFLHNPLIMLKNAIYEAESGAKMHCSKSNINIHQFRRGVAISEEVMMKRRQKKQKNKKCTKKKRQNKTEETEDINLLINKKIMNGSEPNRLHKGFAVATSSFSNRQQSWRENMPAFMDVLLVQTSPSYRASAVVPESKTFTQIVDQPEGEDLTVGKQPQVSLEKEESFANNGTPQQYIKNGNRRKTSTISLEVPALSRRRSKSDLPIQNYAQNSKESKRRSRKSSLLSNDMPLLQRQKSAIDRLQSIQPESSLSSSSSGAETRAVPTQSEETKRSQSARPHTKRKSLNQKSILEFTNEISGMSLSENRISNGIQTLAKVNLEAIDRDVEDQESKRHILNDDRTGQ